MQASWRPHGQGLCWRRQYRPRTGAARTKGRNTGDSAQQDASLSLCAESEPPHFQIPKPNQGQRRGRCPWGHLAWQDEGDLKRLSGEPHARKGWGGQTSHRYLNWLASEMFIAHLHIWRLFHLSNSSDCFTLGSGRQRVHERARLDTVSPSPNMLPSCSPLCQVLG